MEGTRGNPELCVMKPLNFVPPDVAGILSRQRPLGEVYLEVAR